MNRAYSVLTIKELNEELREISGMASTPTADRMGDIVEPDGATFAEEIPLLWQHDSKMPAIGWTKLGKPTPKGIPYVSRVAKIAEPGQLRDMVEMAWQAIKNKLVRGVSIGFTPNEWDFMGDGGVRFMKYEIHELSAVTIPANMEATIASVKAMSAGVVQLRAAPPRPRLDGGAIRLIR